MCINDCTQPKGCLFFLSLVLYFVVFRFFSDLLNKFWRKVKKTKRNPDRPSLQSTQNFWPQPLASSFFFRVSISTPAKARKPARDTYAHEKEPVMSLTSPVRYAPIYPPTLPKELISPTAPAAYFVPDKKVAG